MLKYYILCVTSIDIFLCPIPGILILNSKNVKICNNRKALYMYHGNVLLVSQN